MRRGFLFACIHNERLAAAGGFSLLNFVFFGRFGRCILRTGAVVGYRDEPFGKPVFAAAAHVEVADDRERQRTDEVDEQILHRVQQTNVQIPAQPQCGLGAVRLHDNDVGDVFQHSGRIAARGVQV